MPGHPSSQAGGTRFNSTTPYVKRKKSSHKKHSNQEKCQSHYEHNETHTYFCNPTLANVVDKKYVNSACPYATMIKVGIFCKFLAVAFG